MTDPVIRLDESRPYSECRGERQPDDPHYRVTHFQAFKVGKNHIALPFDAHGILVPDDGKTEPYQGMVDGKPVTHYPLYNQAMRDLVAKMKERMTSGGKSAEVDDDAEAVPAKAEEVDDLDAVNFAAWLRGEMKYDWPKLQQAAKERYGRSISSKKNLVEFLVLDEEIITEKEVCPEFRKSLPTQAAA